MALWYECGHGLVKTSFARSDLGVDAYLVCPGPSLADVDSALLAQPGIMTFGINTSYPKVRPNVWMGADEPHCYDPGIWWEPFVKLIRRQVVDGIDLSVVGDKHLRHCPNTFFIDLERAQPMEMFQRRAHDVKFVWCGNTLTSMLHVMVWMGARRIRLVGCDFGGARAYHDTRRLRPQHRESNRRLYSQQVEMLRSLVPVAKANRLELVSCTEGSPVNAFMPFKPLGEAVRDSLDRLPRRLGRLLHSKDAELCRWHAPRCERGVVVGCAPGQESLLDQWRASYPRFNDLPVVFADLGVSKAFKAKLADLGEVIDSTDTPVNGLFRKPFAILRAPFLEILWADLSEEIRCDVNQFFAEVKFGGRLQIAAQPADSAGWTDGESRSPATPKGTCSFGTKIIAVRHGSHLISDWAAALLDPSMPYATEEEAFCDVVSKQNEHVGIIGPRVLEPGRRGPGGTAVGPDGPKAKSLRSAQRRCRADPVIACSDVQWEALDLGASIDQGVLVGSDEAQAWLLRWWWDNYARHNSWPVCFADFGLSDPAIAWCAERGIVLPVRERFVHPRVANPMATTFIKPLALLRTPFRRTIMMDLDCEVRGSIAPLFDFAAKGCGLREDAFDRDRFVPRPAQAGVVCVARGHALIPDWAKYVIAHWHTLHGDQSALNAVLSRHLSNVTWLPQRYHRLRLEGDDPGAVIMHWTGSIGKRVIREKMLPPVKRRAPLQKLAAAFSEDRAGERRGGGYYRSDGDISPVR